MCHFVQRSFKWDLTKDLSCNPDSYPDKMCLPDYTGVACPTDQAGTIPAIIFFLQKGKKITPNA